MQTWGRATHTAIRREKTIQIIPKASLQVTGMRPKGIRDKRENKIKIYRLEKPRLEQSSYRHDGYDGQRDDAHDEGPHDGWSRRHGKNDGAHGRRHEDPRRRSRRQWSHMVRTLENLNLTSEQWDRVRRLAADRLDKMADLWAQRMKLQIGLASLRWDKEIDPQQVKDLFMKKAEAQAEMFLAGRRYLRGLNGILTPEQLRKFEGQEDSSGKQ